MPANQNAENAKPAVECPTCGKALKSRRALTLHNRVVHEGKAAFGAASRAAPKVSASGAVVLDNPVEIRAPEKGKIAARSIGSEALNEVPPEGRGKYLAAVAEADAKLSKGVSPSYGLATPSTLDLLCPLCVTTEAPDTPIEDSSRITLHHGPVEGSFMGRCERCGLILGLPFPSPAGKTVWARCQDPYSAEVTGEAEPEPEPEIPRYEAGTILRYGGSDHSVTKKGTLEWEMLPPRRGIEVTGRFYAGDTLYEIVKGKAVRVEEEEED